MISLDDIPESGVAVALDLSDILAPVNVRPKHWQSGNAYAGPKPPVLDSPDLRRIIELPRRERPTEYDTTGQALVELLTQRYGRDNPKCNCRTKGRECIRRLRLAQAWALYEIGVVSGLLGPIGVGHGKTVLDILAALAMPRCELALLLVPPSLVDQLIAEYELIEQHFRVPALKVHGRPYTSEGTPGTPVLHVLPYSRLSRPESTAFLESLRPDTVIADEVHRLRHADGAGTSRVLRYFSDHPEVRFCGWSGSLTDSSIRDYSHLSALALRQRSPLPLDTRAVDDWARALDPGDNPAPAGALFDLCDEGEHVQAGFHRRLVTTEGVVSTQEPAVDCAIEVAERPAPALPESVASALRALRETWTRPDGEELVEALEVARCARELASGFYYRWRFPRKEPVPVILEWLEARKEWHREMREILKQRLEYLDSPLLCARAAARAWGDAPDDPELPAWRARTWPRWVAARPTVYYETEPVRIHDFLARDAAEWALTERGIVWYDSSAFGAWVGELSGLPVHGGGPDAGPKIAEEKGDRSIIASTKAHGTGRDGLQRIFDRCLIAQPPSSATQWEQVLGRLHRIGQQSPTVRAWYYAHTPEVQDAIDEATQRARYVERTVGSRQKMTTGRR